MVNKLLREINGISYLPVDKKQLRRITPKYLEFLFIKSMKNRCYKTYKLFSLINQARILEMDNDNEEYQYSLKLLKSHSGKLIYNRDTFSRGYVVDLFSEPNHIIVLNLSKGKLDIWNVKEIAESNPLELSFLSDLTYHSEVFETVKF